MDELEQWSRQLGTDECQAALDRFGVPCSRYRTVEEAMADPQLAHREAFTEVFDAGGTFKALNPPFRFSAAPAAARPFVAGLGEHGDQVLAEAGYSAEEIDTLRKSGALG
jgi:crotonobetainyl-CoA:carnitine CoA-transferase CaiB-like acyl-CoA transferase